MNPYDIDTSKLKESKLVTDERGLLKFKLCSAFNEVTSDMTTEEIISITGLDKSDISRLRVTGVQRFTLDRLVNLLDLLGYMVNIEVTPKKKTKKTKKAKKTKN